MPTYQLTMSREFWTDLGRLPPAVYPRAIQTAGRMISDPWATELHPEKIRQAESGVHSCRVDEAYRIIWKHIKPVDVVLCLVDRHDEAYRRAARKAFCLEDGVVKVADILDVGAAPREQTDNIFGWFRRGKPEVGALFLGYRDAELLDIGVPADVLPNVRALDNVNQLDLVERLLPVDVYDRLVALALGVVDRPVVPDSDLQRSLEQNQGGDDLCRFVDSSEFKRALAGTMQDWMLFLAPAQRQLVHRRFAGPARIKGVAGSGKTVVAIHRARQLAQKAAAQDRRILFLTYGNRLPGVLEHLLRHLAGEGAPEVGAVECKTIHQWCSQFLREHGRRPQVDSAGEAQAAALDGAVAEALLHHPGLRIWSRPQAFFADEIRYAIKGRAVQSLEDYLALDRSGRGSPLQEAERRAVWEVYQRYQVAMHGRGMWDFDDFVLEALRLVEAGSRPTRYAAAVVDEIQDLTEAVMRLVRCIVPPGSDDLFLVGDGLQRIYPGGYALGRLGISIEGRGTVLRRNYRNTQQILRAAQAVMSGQAFDDLDDSASKPEEQEAELSVRQGEVPLLRRLPGPEQELQWIAAQITELRAKHGYKDSDFAILYRWKQPYRDLIARHLAPAVSVVELGRGASSYFGPGVKHTTFHSAKGLEFKVVFVAGVTDGQFVPRDDWTLQGEELEESLARERRLLYVAMTRARDLLFLTCSRGQPSRFLAQVPPAILRRS